MTIDRKPIFDAFRAVLGRGFTTAEVAALDRAFDEAEGKVPTPVLPVSAVSPTYKSAFHHAVIAHLRQEEGVRAKAYKDHLGYWTIGVGRLIDRRKGGRITPGEDAILRSSDPSRCGKEWGQYVLTDTEIDMLLLNDVARFADALEDWPAWKAVQGNVARKVALLSMAFQMGPDGLRGFKNSLKLVEQEKYADAASNFMKSLWAKQTPARAKRVTNMIRTGKLE